VAARSWSGGGALGIDPVDVDPLCGERGARRSVEPRDARDAAKEVGIVERGENVPSLTIVLKLALALEVTPSELLTDFTMAAMKRLRLNE